FRENDPDRPSLDFGGRMQARGYEITAQVGGTLDSPEVILSSIPPLPREDLLLFVLTGAPPGNGGADGGSFTNIASPMAVYLGKNVVGQLIGGTSRAGKTDFQDRIELQIGREMTRSGSVTIDARLLLRNNPIGDASTLYLTSEKDIYDQYNAGLKILFKIN
ncbi:MAG: translocation/assembly module TamB domain-containing protein, partial [Legionella sp.]|nr:translocation/assembly module TamB domain-containing protein [Legionella sp.]